MGRVEGGQGEVVALLQNRIIRDNEWTISMLYVIVVCNETCFALKDYPPALTTSPPLIRIRLADLPTLSYSKHIYLNRFASSSAYTGISASAGSKE